MSWLIYLVRVCAAGLIVLTGFVFLLACAFSKDASWMMYGISSVIAVGGLLSWPRRPNAWRRDPPTMRQIEYADHLGIAIPTGVTKGQLSDMISEAKGEAPKRR